ncbi:MAG: glutamate synthase large subunit [Armatimonadota bacterium]
MTQVGIPPKQGLYDPNYEHDACGVGFVASIKGEKSHSIISDALQILVSLDHRGARGAEENTGDGAGILMQIPDSYFREVCKDIALPPSGDYGVGMIFLPPFLKDRRNCMEQFEEIVSEEGQTVIGWRRVHTDSLTLGRTAKRSEPSVYQVFIAKDESLKDQIAFERKLFVIRRRAELEIRHQNHNIFFYISSLSSRTIIYKGLLTPQQVEEFYPELSDKRMESALALVHSRFSTNTFPSWERAHPYRYIIHNGEINTLRSNVNWMHARQALFASDLFGADLQKIMPVIDSDGSDSAMFDNCFEFLTLAGRSLPHAMMMMIPEPWLNHGTMDDDLRAFYQYHSCLMEPWDGPASIIFTDGTQIGAVLDRNGLRPSRYYITSDDRIIMASEAGVLDVPAEQIIRKGRLKPGEMFLLDTDEGRIVSDSEIKSRIATEHPYQQWLDNNMIQLSDLDPVQCTDIDSQDLITRQQAFGYTYEDLRMVLEPMAKDGQEPLGSMGIDTPIAVLSDKPQLLYSYFKQLFAQVTNPPIDAIREEIVTSVETTIGPERNLLDPKPESCRQIVLHNPVLTNEELEKLRCTDIPGFKSATLPILFNPEHGSTGLRRAIDDLYENADRAIEDGANIIILSDRGISKKSAPIPALLAVSGLHHHLIRAGTRTKIGLVLESGEPREVHHFSLLVGYGVGAINPYMVYETLDDMIKQGMLTGVDYEKAVYNFVKGSVKGIVKTMSKMGISTIQSYRGAQIFEALGISDAVIRRYFTWTPSRIDGIGMKEITEEVLARHNRAFPDRVVDGNTLDVGGDYQWRSEGEYHLYNPESIYKLQQACSTGNFNTFKQYSQIINDQSQNKCTLRGLLDFHKTSDPVSIDEVEPVESIVKRFKTGAMSYGSISKEAHEALAIAMNRLGGKSNTGEGGEDPDRFTPDANGDSRCSAIKQVASGRFGVTSNYLVNAQELQIKMAQGAKPGEGGQLPGEKVYPWIAKVRMSTPGVGLISPPPHHDIYSIEDLAELIFDLKNANRWARISVKLVSEVGVGTIAAGVAKAHADTILISGYDGGTGASPRSSIRHAGLPWELGIAEAHQTLVLNELRDRVTLETDGKLLTGRDVVVAALLGAQEFGFATTPLITLGCVMMRVCQKDTCPAGIATQNPELRKCFNGSPDNVVNFMTFIAQEVREIMAELGFKTIDEMVGRSDVLKMMEAINHWKAEGLDLSPLLHKPSTAGSDRAAYVKKDMLAESLDMQYLVPACEPAIEHGEKVEVSVPIRTMNRTAGTILGSEVSKRYGEDGLPEDTIRVHFAGSAGQSFGAFVPRGITLLLEGEANDYIGKGLSGGKMIVYPSTGSSFVAEENIIIGNVAFYGATSGEAYIRGAAGERFCVRNSGVKAVVESVGDHGCEYMTGGRVVILGPTGKNFAAGMSGGIAYIYDKDGKFPSRCNMEMVDLESLVDQEEILEVREMIRNHATYTGSTVAEKVLEHWTDELPKFVKVIPKDFKRMLDAINKAIEDGLSGDDAVLTAFESNIHNPTKVGAK